MTTCIILYVFLSYGGVNEYFKYNILKALSNNIFPYFENNKIKCYIDSVFKFKDVIKAHQRLYEGKHIGKVILDVGI